MRGTELEVRADRVAAEERLEISAAGPGQDPVPVTITMRTPGHEAELAAGFLRTEGLIGNDDVVRVRFRDPSAGAVADDAVIVELRRALDASSVAERHVLAAASSGIRAEALLDEVAAACEPLPDGPMVRREVILRLPAALRAAQQVVDDTDWVHAAGLFSVEGAPVVVREDVGQHNALDKLVGSQLLAGRLPLHDRLLVVTGPVSFGTVRKAAIAGIPFVAAVSTPSSLAVEAAQRLGVTLVGVLRDDGFNVYAHDRRIDLSDLLAT
ncbi:MAG TPA: formate dehydrogenase accessory sulfurtransferase FdhD [Candidatus Limnocylindrales bacterium]|nr:formate dehydrogenase accessory sulfurtransferase FdhD [Candidatus Limnocylindrales bacterium]